MGYSSWGHEESDTTEWLTLSQDRCTCSEWTCQFRSFPWAPGLSHLGSCESLRLYLFKVLQSPVSSSVPNFFIHRSQKLRTSVSSRFFLYITQYSVITHRFLFQPESAAGSPASAADFFSFFLFFTDSFFFARRSFSSVGHILPLSITMVLVLILLNEKYLWPQTRPFQNGVKMSSIWNRGIEENEDWEGRN